MSLYSPSSVTAPGQAFQPINAVPALCGNVVLSAVPVLLVADDTRSNGARRVLVRNFDAAETAGVQFFARGASIVGQTLATSFRIPPGAEASFVVDCELSIAAVASGACTVSALVSDA